MHVAPGNIHLKLFKSNQIIHKSNLIDGILLALSRPYSSRLTEVGKLENRQPSEESYPPGQTFLHQVFGYRGVVLFPWLAKVHDIDFRKQYTNSASSSNSGTLESHNKHFKPLSHRKTKQSIDRTSPAAGFNLSGKSSTSSLGNSQPSHSEADARLNRFHPYYQVLIDSRDCPFVSNRTQTEAVTFLGHPENSKSVYSVKGLDYVAHDDIMPYTSQERPPIQHDLLSKLFLKNNSQNVPGHYRPSELLENWKSKHPWLELSRVYRETTENIRITVMPFYLGHTNIECTTFHWWRYCVRLENFSEASVQLRERNWKIFSKTNMLQTIKGRGVVGVEPILTKQEPAYQYSSHVNLQDRSGHMWGTFKMQREDGHTFECNIPPFSLESSANLSGGPSSKQPQPQPQPEPQPPIDIDGTRGK